MRAGRRGHEGRHERGEVWQDGETGGTRVRFFGRGERERAVEIELGCRAEPPRDEGEDGELRARHMQEEEGERDRWVLARLEADVAGAVWLISLCICCRCCGDNEVLLLLQWRGRGFGWGAQEGGRTQCAGTC